MPVLRPSGSDFTSFVKAAAQYVPAGTAAKVSKSGGVSVALPGLGAVVRTSQIGALSSPTTSAVVINGVTAPIVPSGSSPAGAPMDPKTIAGIVLWLDGADPAATGTIPSAGAAISTWVDKSGKGYNATLYGTTSPTYVANKSLQFTGSSNTSLASPVPAQTFSNGLSLFVVFVKTVGVNTYESLVSRSTNDPIPFDMWGVNRMWGSYGNYLSGTAPSIASYTTQTVLSITMSTTLNWSENINGTNAVSYNTTNFNNGSNGTPAWNDTGTNIYIGTRGDSVTRFTGQISEILAYSSVLSTPDRQKAEGYLAWKWGLQANLPAGHPYKTAAPV